MLYRKCCFIFVTLFVYHCILKGFGITSKVCSVHNYAVAMGKWTVQTKNKLAATFQHFAVAQTNSDMQLWEAAAPFLMYFLTDGRHGNAH